MEHLRLEESLNLQPTELRAYILSYWKALPHRHYTTMGILLSRVKEEGLAQTWGYQRYSHYLVKELDIFPPSIANIWTGIVNKLRQFFDFSIAEIEALEKKVPQQLMAVSLRYAKNRQELESIWQRANYKSIRWTGLDKQKFTEREVRKAAWDHLFFNDQEAVLLESLTNFLRIRYKLPTGGEKRSRVVMVLALVYKGLIERGEEGMESWLRRELERFNLPLEIADIKVAMFKTPRNIERVKQLAEEVVSRKLVQTKKLNPDTGY